MDKIPTSWVGHGVVGQSIVVVVEGHDWYIPPSRHRHFEGMYQASTLRHPLLPVVVVELQKWSMQLL